MESGPKVAAKEAMPVWRFARFLLQIDSGKLINYFHDICIM